MKNKTKENGNNEGYPLYPETEDIYAQSKNMTSLDPENPAKMKATNQVEKNGDWNEKGFTEDVTGSDLDVPGRELDDKDEKIGEEDEENNYYSLGGDEHNDLDEDKG